MPFSYILDKLVADTEGAVGALFVDDTGETVGHTSAGPGADDLKVLGAWMGIHLRRMTEYMPGTRTGDLPFLHVEHERLHLFASPLPDGYYLVLAQRAPALAAQTRRRVTQAARLLHQELFDDG